MAKKAKKGGKGPKGGVDKVGERCDDIVWLTDAFCDAHLDEEYLELCRDMVEALYEMNIAVERGRAESWACGIVHALGMVNFLGDPSMPVHMKSSDVAAAFGVSPGTMQTKSQLIRDELDMTPMDPEWCLDSLLADNPMVWMIEVDGIVVDIRDAPREVQEEVYLEGLIPYIPADQIDVEADANGDAKILKFPGGGKEDSGSEPVEDGGGDEQILPLFDGLDE